MLLFILLALPAAAWGCTCIVSPLGAPACHEALLYPTVFTGVVIQIGEPSSVVDSPFGQGLVQQRIRFRVTEPFQGIGPAITEIEAQNGLGRANCGYDFQLGVEYIVYASSSHLSPIAISRCSPTRPVVYASDDLRYFHGLARAPDSGEILALTLDHRTRQPISGVQLIVQDRQGRQSATTGADGRHTFTDLSPGNYRIDASLEGYTTLNTPSVVPLWRRACAFGIVELAVDRRITGRVTSLDGRPVGGVHLQTVPIRPRTPADTWPASDGSAVSGVDGRYELRNLTPGDYYLGVSINEPPSIVNPYERWFYPGTGDSAEAKIVHVGEIPGTQSFDFALPRRRVERVILGDVTWPDGRPASSVHIILQDASYSLQTYTVAGSTDNQGHFKVSGLASIAYRLHAANFAIPQGPKSAQPMFVAPGADPLRVMLVLDHPGYSPDEESGDALKRWRRGLGIQ